MAALDFPASPGFGQSHVQNGSAWQWDNEKWKVNVLGTYLPLLGGTMLGPMTLFSDAVNPLDPVTLRQGTSLYVPLVGGGNVTGPTTIMGAAFTAKKNLMINMPEPPNMSTATTTDGGSIRAWYMTANNYMFSVYYDGASFRRLNATDTPSQLSAAGGTLVYQTAGTTGAANTTVTLNQVFTVTPQGNLGITYGVPPGTMTGLVSAKDVVVNNAYGTNLYYDGAVWRYRAAGSGSLIHLDTSIAPQLNFYNSPVGAAGGASTLTNRFTIHGSGATSQLDFYVARQLFVSSYNSYEWSLYTDGSGHHIQNHRSGWYQLWNTSNGTWQWVSPSGQRMSLDGNATLTVNGYLYGASNGRVDGSWTAGSSIYSYNGRIISQAAGNASLTVYSTNAGYAYGLYLDGATLNFCNSYGDGTPAKYLGQINLNGDLNMIGAGTFGYIHSTGSIQADGDSNASGNMTCGRMRATNGIMNVNGAFYVADNGNYYLARSGYDGHWRFVENGTDNFRVQTDGTCVARSAFQSGWLRSTGGAQVDGQFTCSQLLVWNYGYAGGWFVGGYGDTGFGLYRNGNTKYMQQSPNWYWVWDPNNGTHIWNRDVNGGATAFWVMRNDDLCYNNRGRTGGIGPYADFSDRRGKTAIAPATEGLAEILQLDPVRFQRIPPSPARTADGRVADPKPIRHELGFIAQDVLTVLPEAVEVVGIELPDGKGGMNDANPTLALAYSMITVALVNAVKELNSRLIALEGSPA